MHILTFKVWFFPKPVFLTCSIAWNTVVTTNNFLDFRLQSMTFSTAIFEKLGGGGGGGGGDLKIFYGFYTSNLLIFVNFLRKPSG